MVRETKTKTFTLFLTVAILIIAIFAPCNSGIASSSLATLHPGCSCIDRLLYPFFHASFFHAALNCWCLLSLVFAYHISIHMLALAFVVASSVPSIIIGGPTVGLSGICFFLMGRCSFLAQRTLLYHFYCIFYLAIGFLFPACAASLHLYSYICGFFIGWLNSTTK